MSNDVHGASNFPDLPNLSLNSLKRPLRLLDEA